jgi:hypothetical protein
VEKGKRKDYMRGKPVKVKLLDDPKQRARRARGQGPVAAFSTAGLSGHPGTVTAAWSWFGLAGHVEWPAGTGKTYWIKLAHAGFTLERR